VPQRLDRLGERIERLVREPEAGAELWVRLASPILRALDWKPEIHIERADWLLAELSFGTADTAELSAAVDELEQNLTELERACVVDDEMPTAYVGWMWRLYGVLCRARELLQGADPHAIHGFAESAAIRILPPLTDEAAPGEPAVRVGDIDVLLDAALHETELLGRRRRLLEAAREVLLDTATALSLDADQTNLRHAYITQQIARINRFEAAGVLPDVGLGHQLKEAVRRREGDRAHALLSALSEAAGRRGDAALERRTRTALSRIRSHWPQADRGRQSLMRSGLESLGPAVVDAVYKALQQARDTLGPCPTNASISEQVRWAKHREYLEQTPEHALFSAALSVDGAFDLGQVMSRHRVPEEVRLRREVHHPTQELRVSLAKRVDDLQSAIVGDPRSLLYDLAAGRLLTRRYVAEERHKRERPRMTSEVRIYVLDGSGSMLGPRAQMRDAIMVSELSTMIDRLLEPDRSVNTVLFYRYFNDEPGPVTRVDSADTAVTAVGDVVANTRVGGTNIELALLASFEQIRQARLRDQDLARAQVVLITDGNARVSLRKISAARQSSGVATIGVSVVALGEENAALREMAALQRARGERVFYHFVPDTMLEAIASGRAHGPLPVHLPQGVSIEALGPELEALADEIEAILQQRDIDAMEMVDDWQEALREVGLDPTRALCHGEQARVEALRRDREALGRRFDRWFPAIDTPIEGSTATQVSPRRAEDDAEDVLALQAMLHGVACVVDTVASSELRRYSDAVEIMERMLLDAGIGPWRYRELLQRYPQEFAVSIAQLREDPTSS